MNTVNRSKKNKCNENVEFMTEEEMLAMERSEEDRKKSQTHFTRTQMTDMMRNTGATEGSQVDINGLNLDRRSRRVTRDAELEGIDLNEHAESAYELASSSRGGASA